MSVESYLVDTNILLRLVQPTSPDHKIIRDYTDRLWEQGALLFYTSQNLAEFWNVCTRPASQNGFGFSIADTEQRASQIEAKLAFLCESETTHREWRRIIVSESVSGVQVHDARLVAAMHVYRIARILTLNVKDFRRYKAIAVVSPHDSIHGHR